MGRRVFLQVGQYTGHALGIDAAVVGKTQLGELLGVVLGLIGGGHGKQADR